MDQTNKLVRKLGRFLGTENKRTILLLVLLIIVGLSLRLYNLDEESVWLDEACTVDTAKHSLPEILLRNLEGSHLPLYHTLMYGWIRLFGTSEFSIRFPSVIFGILAMLMLFRVGRLLFGERVALIATLFMTVLHYQISFSQNARMYTLFTFLALCSAYFFLLALQQNRRKWWSWYLASTILLLYTHFYAGLFVSFQAVYFLLRIRHHKSLWKQWVLSQAVLFLFFLPIFFLPKYLEGRVLYTLPTLRVIEDALTAMSFIPAPRFQDLTILLGEKTLWINIAFVLSMFLVAKAVWHLYRGRQIHSLLFSLLWLLIPIFGALGIHYFIFHYFFDRYLMPITAPLYLLMAVGINSIKRASVKIILSVLIAFLIVSSINHYYTSDHHEQWRELVRHIEEHITPQELVVVTYAQSSPPFDYYWTKNNTVIRASNSTDIVLGLNRTDCSHTGIWWVLYDRASAEQADNITRYFEQDYALLETETFRQLYLMHARPKNQEIVQNKCLAMKSR